ncbi:MAG: class I SAM-dependent methyltransferase [Candidatus Sungbacteria bacterium]|nr:class I SAM-dependent methyltransferase [Candidatus Sungbacteria bacterium]
MATAPTPNVPWYSEEAGFFGPGYLQEYSGMLTEERTQAEVDFLEHALGLRQGMKILDCPCGHGRHAIELACRGYIVTGQDLNGFFLAQAEATRTRLYPPPYMPLRWVQGDMRQIPFEEEFDIALNLFTAFGYLESDAEDQQALNAVARSLRHSGKFVLDVMNRDRVARVYRERDWQHLPGGATVLTERAFDHVTGRNTETRTRISSNGERKEFTLVVRMYTVAELAAMMRTAGLEIKETYGSYRSEPLTFDSPRSILIAEKA